VGAVPCQAGNAKAEPTIIGTYPMVFTLVEGSPQADLDDTRLALFAQDTWQIHPKLRLDYGLRYDLSTFTLPTRRRFREPGFRTAVLAWTGQRRAALGLRVDAVHRRPARGARRRRDLLRQARLAFPAVSAIASNMSVQLAFPQAWRSSSSTTRPWPRRVR